MLQIDSISSGSKGNAYLVSDGETRILIECGVRIEDLHKATDYELSKVAGCLVSHQHNDHCKALPAVMSSAVNCYAPAEVFDARGVHGHRGIPVVPGQQFRVGTFTVKAFPVEHDVVNFGYLLGSNKTRDKLLYFTDTFYLKYKFTGLTYIMGEVNHDGMTVKHNNDERRARLAQTHMSIDTFCDFLRANDLHSVKAIYLLHLSDTNSDEKEFVRRVQGIVGCEVYAC